MDEVEKPNNSELSWLINTTKLENKFKPLEHNILHMDRTTTSIHTKESTAGGFSNQNNDKMHSFLVTNIFSNNETK
jgi:hypothetical protein